MPKILVIDDNQELQDLYKEIFEGAGYTYLATKTGSSGVQLALTDQPDAVILDIMLGDGTNGFDIIKDLKRHPNTQSIPIIVMTNLDSEKKQALEMGVREYLIKANTSFDQLLEIVKQYIPPITSTKVK